MPDGPQDASPVLLYGPVLISDPSLGCPITVAAARVRPARDGDSTPRFATGWGRDAGSAMRRCVFEAEETYYAQGVRAATRARLDALRGAVAPPRLLLVSERQFEARAFWNETYPGRDAIPPRWQPDRAIGWLQADAGPDAAPAFVPAGLCGLGSHPDEPAGLPAADSNGLATGESPADAARRAFLELVERDACAIWWYNRLLLPRLDPTALGDSLVAAYRDWLDRLGRRLVLLDLTHDLAVPIVAALSHDCEERRIALGFGVGPSARAAALHAVGELAQCEANLALIDRQAARGNAGFSAEARRLLAWWRDASLRDHTFLRGGDPGAPHACAAPPGLDECRALCRHHGLTLLTVDLTPPGGPPLARAFVPGLRPVRPRFGPGRLYDVPHRRGLAPLAEDALNPDPFPI